MILVDTSIWIDHLRAGSRPLATMLELGVVLGHPWVVGELALGNLRNRSEVLNLLHSLPQTAVARDGEVLGLIEAASLHGEGVGFVDAHLLAATQLTHGASLWSGDKRLMRVAERLDMGFEP